jgi:hypothetical protein
MGFNVRGKKNLPPKNPHLFNYPIVGGLCPPTIR